MSFADVETLVKNWLTTTYLAPLVTRPDGGVSIYKAMPNAAPVPSIVLRRVGGAPDPAADMPLDVARISFNCWATSRDEAVQLSLTLVSLLEELAPTGGYDALKAAETVMWLWLPDEDSDIPRYVVDARFAVLTD